MHSGSASPQGGPKLTAGWTLGSGDGVGPGVGLADGLGLGTIEDVGSEGGGAVRLGAGAGPQAAAMRATATRLPKEQRTRGVRVASLVIGSGAPQR